MAALFALFRVFASRRLAELFQVSAMLTAARHRTEVGLLRLFDELLVLSSYCSRRSARGPPFSALHAARAVLSGYTFDS